MNQPLVTVIIATYNRAYCIKNAIDSAINQSYANKEIFVIDDGSTDETKELLLNYGDAITAIFKPNTGKSASRNEGLRRSNGSIIAALDSDDIWYENYLEKSVKCLMKHNLDLFFSSWQERDKEFNALLKYSERACNLLPYQHFRSTILTCCPSPTSGVVFKKDMIEFGWNENIDEYEDWHLQIESIIKKNTAKIGFTFEHLWRKGDDEANIAKRKSISFLKQRVDAAESLYENLAYNLTKHERWIIKGNLLKDNLRLIKALIVQKGEVKLILRIISTLITNFNQVSILLIKYLLNKWKLRL